MTKAAGVPVVWRERPFSGRLHCKTFAPNPYMPTIAEIVAGLDDLPRGFERWGEVRINGDLVPRKMWRHARPKYRPRNETVVSLHAPIRGPSGGGGQGGGGGKNTFALIASIAVLVAAAAVSFGVFGTLGSFAIGSAVITGAQIAGAVIGIGGALAIAALVPPPSLSAQPGGSQQAAVSSSGSATPTNPSAASLSGNVLSPGSSVPRVIGTMRLFPPLICNPLVEVVGDLEFVEAVFALAGPHTLANVESNGTAVNSLTQVQTQLVEGKGTDAIQNLVTRQSVTTQTNAELAGHLLDKTTQFQLQDQGNPAADVPQIQTLTSRKGPDEVWINLAWPSGLYKGDVLGTAVNQAVRIQFRRRSDSTFIKCPELHFSQNQAGSFQKVIRLKWGAIPTPPNTPPTNQGPVYAFKHVPGQDGSTATPASAGWDADPYFSAASGNDLLSASAFGPGSNVKNTELYSDKAIFYLDPAIFPQDDFYEIQVVRSCPYLPGSFNTSNYQYTGTVYDLFQYYTTGGVSRIPVDVTNYQDRVIATRMSSVWNQNPIQSLDFATISIRASGQALSQVSVLAAGYVNDWNGSSWSTFGTTSNPAPHLYDILTGSLGNSSIDASLVDSAEIVTWRQHCIDQGYTVNAVIEGKTYADAVNVCCNAGYASVRHNEKWGVISDRDRSADAPVQIFTARNMANFSWTRAFANLPSGILAIFQDSANEYQQAQAIIFDDPSREDADNLQQMTYDGLVTLADVTQRAHFDLDQAKGRFTFYSGDVPIEAIVAQRGDLVAVQHDTLITQAGFSRIIAIARDTDTITGFTLDGSVPTNTTTDFFSTPNIFVVPNIFLLGQKTGITIRLKGGNGFITREITAAVNGDNTVVLFKTPLLDPGTSEIDLDCLVAVGPLGSEHKRLIVYGVAPKDDFLATMTFVDEAPQLWN